MKLSDLDKKIISLLQGDLSLSPEPFKDLAAEVGIAEDVLLEKISDYKQRGILRRLGAILYHRKAGYRVNAMCCWYVPPQLIDITGQIMASFREASHVYHRVIHPEWPYSIYTMIHGHSREELEHIVNLMAEKTKINDYILLYSNREFKKTSMKYF